MMPVGRAAKDDANARLGAMLTAEFVSHRGELVRHCAIPTLKVPARLGGREPRSNFDSQMVSEVVKAILYFNHGVS